MKKAIVLAIVGLAAGVASSYGQGAIILDNYNTYGPNITYGAGSDGTAGVGVGTAYTMGVYYWNAAGNNVGGTLADPTGKADPTTLGSYLLGSGNGSTAPFAGVAVSGIAGQALAGATFNIPGSDPNGGQVWTFMIVAYEGANYASALYRGHSGAFVLTTAGQLSTTPTKIGTAMPGFQVFQNVVPEPTTMALGGLGLASLLLFRRKQA